MRRTWWRTSGEIWKEIFELLLLGKIVRNIFHQNSTANFTIKLHYEVLGCGGPYNFSGQSQSVIVLVNFEQVTQDKNAQLSYRQKGWAKNANKRCCVTSPCQQNSPEDVFSTNYPKDAAVRETLRDRELLRRSVFISKRGCRNGVASDFFCFFVFFRFFFFFSFSLFPFRFLLFSSVFPFSSVCSVCFRFFSVFFPFSSVFFFRFSSVFFFRFIFRKEKKGETPFARPFLRKPERRNLPVKPRKMMTARGVAIANHCAIMRSKFTTA